MIIDTSLEVSQGSGNLSFAGTGLQLVANQVDLGLPQRDMGPGAGDLYLVVEVVNTITSAGAATVEFQLVSDAQPSIAVDGSASVHVKSGAIPKAKLVAGAIAWVAKLPQGVVSYEQYLGLLADVGVAVLTAGKVRAFFTPNPPTLGKLYNDAL
jgi:hypothetical protein